MRVLGIETATANGSVALVGPAGLTAEVRLSPPPGPAHSPPPAHAAHAERLMILVEQLLREQAAPLEALDGYAVSIGPGSFTGLRVGLATVKGLARACPRPTAAVSTLEALAWAIPAETGRLVCPVLDARQQEVFAALFRRVADPDRSLICVMPAQAMTPEALMERITEPTVFAGIGAELYRPLLERLGVLAHCAPASVTCSAGAVAQLGAEQLRRGEGQPAVGLAPVYLRRSMAEETRRRPSHPPQAPQAGRIQANRVKI